MDGRRGSFVCAGFTLINQFILNNVSLSLMRGWRRFNSNVHRGIEAKLQCLA